MKTGNRHEAIANTKIAKVSGLALGVMLFALCSSAEAQQAGKVFRIGFLDNSAASGIAVLSDAFRQELRKLGWIEGKNITLEYRFSEQKRGKKNESKDFCSGSLRCARCALRVRSSAAAGESLSYRAPG